MLTIKDATLGKVRYGGDHEVKLNITYGPMSYDKFALSLDEEGVARVLETIRAEAGRILGVIDYEQPEVIKAAPESEEPVGVSYAEPDRKSDVDDVGF